MALKKVQQHKIEDVIELCRKIILYETKKIKHLSEENLARLKKGKNYTDLIHDLRKEHSLSEKEYGILHKVEKVDAEAEKLTERLLENSGLGVEHFLKGEKKVEQFLRHFVHNRFLPKVKERMAVEEQALHNEITIVKAVEKDAELTREINVLIPVFNKTAVHLEALKKEVAAAGKGKKATKIEPGGILRNKYVIAVIVVLLVGLLWLAKDLFAGTSGGSVRLTASDGYLDVELTSGTKVIHTETTSDNFLIQITNKGDIFIIDEKEKFSWAYDVDDGKWYNLQSVDIGLQDGKGPIGPVTQKAIAYAEQLKKKLLEKTKDDSVSQAEPRKELSLAEVVKILGVSDVSRIQFLSEGYKTSKSLDGDVRDLAGIYAGTVRVKKTETGYVTEGFYSELRHPDALLTVSNEADTNGDKIITRDEIRALTIKVYEENAR
ncbi:hypothetical protein ACFL0W_02675 [Nanoarchaeota archaeon]